MKLNRKVTIKRDTMDMWIIKIWIQWISFQKDEGSSSFAWEFTVEKESSKTTWYWGEIWIVLIFKTRGTPYEWCTLNPRKIPWCALGYQRGSFFPCCKVWYMTYTVHPHTWMSFHLWRGICLPVNKSAGAIPCSFGRRLCIYVA